MKNVFTVFLFLYATIYIAAAQSNFPSKTELGYFLNSKTLVVTENVQNIGIGVSLKNAITNQWTITPYEFINNDIFAEKISDENFSFITIIRQNFEKDENEINYNFLNLLLGKAVVNLSELPEFVSIPLNYSFQDDDNYLAMMPLFIKFMQNHIALMQKKPGNSALSKLSYYNRNANLLKNKILLIAEDDLAMHQTSANLKAIYSYPCELVSRDEIRKAIEEKRENTAVLHHVGPGKEKHEGRSYNMILSTSDATLYYYEYFTVSEQRPDGFGEKEFKKLNFRIRFF